jgi:hypothetical protein
LPHLFPASEAHRQTHWDRFLSTMKPGASIHLPNHSNQLGNKFRKLPARINLAADFHPNLKTSKNLPSN